MNFSEHRHGITQFTPTNQASGPLSRTPPKFPKSAQGSGQIRHIRHELRGIWGNLDLLHTIAICILPAIYSCCAQVNVLLAPI